MKRDVSFANLPEAGKILGPVVALLVFYLLPAEYKEQTGKIIEFTTAGRAAAAIGILMAVWWMTEAISIYATALLPLLLFPLTGVASAKAAAAPYGHHLIYLFLGGFIIAKSMERWNLHKRIALFALKYSGTKPAAIIGGFMGVTAFLSMWVSNTATTMMILPIAISVVALIEKKAGQENNFNAALLLGVAYSASIGGIGTLIGTPPNLFLASFLKEQAGMEISFVRWMLVGVPLVLILLPVVWFVLTKILFKTNNEKINFSGSVCAEEYKNLGSMSKGEWNTLIIFSVTAVLWIVRPLVNKITIAHVQPFSGLTDSGIAIFGALLLFLIPVSRKEKLYTMNWDTASKLPWGVLLLFGGGLSLASALQSNGVSLFIGTRVGTIGSLPVLIIVGIVTAVMVLLTELTSNTATTVTFVPVLYAASTGLGLNPLLLTVPAAVSASCAFMLPVATPPNAIVFGSNKIKIGQMVRAGIWFNVLSIIVITFFGYFLIIRILAL
ncbi:anion transporter [candidate division KSB1 bacterium]|nr:MAG: anion transporter [candidate division KSB1 bacterium]